MLFPSSKSGPQTPPKQGHSSGSFSNGSSILSVAQSEGWYQTSSIKIGMHGNDPLPGFLVFFGVPDLDKAIAKVVSLGGKAEAPTEEPGFGRFCFCTDPSGLKFGLHLQRSDH
jgi:predicted enzyme related to lactoylglutathione lyase